MTGCIVPKVLSVKLGGVRMSEFTFKIVIYLELDNVSGYIEFQVCSFVVKAPPFFGHTLIYLFFLILTCDLLIYIQCTIPTSFYKNLWDVLLV